MPKFIQDDIGVFDRALVALNPVYSFLSNLFPSMKDVDGDEVPHPSAMLEEHNWLHWLFFSRPSEKVSVDQQALLTLSAEAARSTIVYVAKGMGQFEYNFFNRLFFEEGLPLAVYTNALTVRRWMKWNAFWRSIAREAKDISGSGRPKNPIDNGSLPDIIAGEKSVLIVISPSELVDDGVFFTGPARALTELIKAKRMSEKPVSIVPLDFLFSKHPKKAGRSVSDILFGEKEYPGRIRRTILFWKSYITKAEAIIGEPIDLGSFIEWEGGDDSRIAARLRGFLIGAFNAQRRTLTGPPVRPRRWFVGEVMGDEPLDENICSLAAKSNKPADDLRELAAKYAREIAADIDHTWLEIADRILNFALRRLFDSVHIDQEGLKKAKDLYAEGPIVFVPNHKSHMDYLVLTHILYHNGMTIPLIAAGINLRFWPLGNIFRHGGAYFIRRSFRDNPLYQAVLETYLKILMKEGYCQEFFIEGGRSRTGKLLAPKKGMLTLLHRAATEAGVKNLNFIPVSITYDRVIEQKSYTKEMEGGAKEKEKTTQLIRLTKYLKRQKNRYGSIYVRFGTPVAATPDFENREDIAAIADDICHDINRRMVATPGAIAAAALLSSGKRGILADEVKRNWAVILAYLEFKGVEISEKIRSSSGTIMDDAIARLMQAKLVTCHDDPVEPFYSIDEDKRVDLAFFKNSIIHFMATAGFVSRIMLKAHSRGISLNMGVLLENFDACRSLMSHEFRCATTGALQEHISNVVDFLASRGALEISSGQEFTIRGGGKWVLDLFADLTAPFIESLWIAFRYATQKMKEPADEKSLIAEMIKAGHDLLLLDLVRYREAITKAGFKEAIGKLVERKVLLMKKPEPKTKGKGLYLPSDNSEAIKALKAELERVF